MKYISQAIKKNPINFVLGLLIVLFCLYFVVLSFARHDNFYSRRLDLGNMDQTVWNVLHGNGFTLTDPAGTDQQSRLAVHADFLLIFLAPFYLLWSNPKILLFLQVIVLGVGAIPIFWIAYEKLKSKNKALLFSLAYLLYPPLQRLALHDFHAVTMSLSFLIFAYWYMVKKKYKLFLVFALLAALGKEDVWITTGLLGLYIAFINKHKIFGLTVAFISFFVFYILMWKLIPSITVSQQHFALTYLSDFGDTQNTIIKNVLLNPIKVIQTFFLPDRLYYYFQLLIPLGMLSVFSPFKLLFSIFSIAINILSNNFLMRIIDYQYHAIITPFVFITAVEGYIWIEKLINKIKLPRFSYEKTRVLAIYFVVSILAASYLWGEMPYGKESRFNYFITPPQEKDAMSKIMDNLDSQFSVSATNNIAAHVSERKMLYNFPVKYDSVDYVFINLNDFYAWPSINEQQAALDDLLKNNNYALITKEGNFYAFKKKN